MREFVDLPFLDEKHSIREVFPEATFYGSVKIEGRVRLFPLFSGGVVGRVPLPPLSVLLFRF